MQENGLSINWSAVEAYRARRACPVDLYGSLSLTGKGHATDTAIMMGLAGNSPQSVSIDAIPRLSRGDPYRPLADLLKVHMSSISRLPIALFSW